jgi:hypothetical protein
VIAAVDALVGVSEALNRSRHRKGTHSAGLLIGDSTDHISMHHNLLVHNSFRNPLIIAGGTQEIVNNVVYNWGDIPAEVVDTDSNSFLNFVSNTFVSGHSSVLSRDAIIVSGAKGTPRLYVEGNRSARRPNNEVDEWAVVTQDWSGTTASANYQAAKRFKTPPVTTWSAEEAHSRVLGEAGATRPQRDEVDLRIVSHVKNGTGAIVDSPSQVGGYPRLNAGSPLVDSDRDGMSDSWE